MFKEFKEFAVKGDAIDLAVGVIVGAAFGAIVKSLVDDIIMPVLSLITGRVDFTNLYLLIKEGSKAPAPYVSLAAAKAAGATTLNYGTFINAIITFVLIAFAVFLMVRAINRLRRKTPPEVTTRPCPYCCVEIPKAALRCPSCTSEVQPVD